MSVTFILSWYRCKKKRSLSTRIKVSPCLISLKLVLPFRRENFTDRQSYFSMDRLRVFARRLLLSSNLDISSFSYNEISKKNNEVVKRALTYISIPNSR